MLRTSCVPRFVVVAFSDDNAHQPASLLHRSIAQLQPASCTRTGWACFSLILLPLTPADNFFCRIERLRAFLREECSASIVLHTDAYDAFIRSPATRLLQRFRRTRAAVVWATEREYSWQDALNKSFYDTLGSDRGPYRYINGGGYVGYAWALRRVMERARYISKFKGADQMAFSRLFVEGCERSASSPARTWDCPAWAAWNVTLDYDSSVFYVASGEDWGASVAHARMRQAKPCVVHVPWASFPRNKRTLLSLFNKSMAELPHAASDGAQVQQRRVPSPPPPTSKCQPGERGCTRPPRRWRDVHSGDAPFWAPRNPQREEHCHAGRWPIPASDDTSHDPGRRGPAHVL